MQERIKYIKIGFLALMLFLTYSCLHRANSSKTEEASIRYHAAEKFYRAGDYGAALRELTVVVTLNPEKYEYRQLAGLTYFAKQLYNEALVEFAVAARLNPRNAEPQMSMGAVYMEMKNWDEAIKHYDMAIANVFYNTPELAYNNKGWAYYSKGDYRRAIDFFEKAAVNPRFALPNYHAGLAYDKLNSYNEAIAAFEKAIKIDKNFTDAYYQLGLIYVKKKNKPEARKAFEKVIELAPGSARATSARDYLDLLKK